MEKYTYRARDRKGLLIKGTIESANLLEAKRNLIDQGLSVVSIGSGQWEKFLSSAQKLTAGFAQPITLEELIVFNRQLQTSYGVGISMVQALSMIGDQTPNLRLKKIISSLIDDLSQGLGLHEAMRKYPDVFDPIYINAVKAGESSGKLEDIFGMLCYFSELKMENDTKVKSATLYPKIILFTIAVVLVVVTCFVMPKLKEFYARFGGELPGITLFVMGISEFVLSYWYLIAAAIGCGIFFFHRFISTAKGRLLWHRALLKTPIFGEIFLQSDVLIFSTVMRLLLQSGLPIIESFHVVRDSMTNQVLKDEIDFCAESVEAGQSVSYGFSQSRVFPKMVGNLISVGEESGKIDDVLAKVSSYYKLQLEYRLNNLSKAIEPLFLFLIFGIVLVLMLAIFMPIWKMSQLVRMKG